MIRRDPSVVLSYQYSLRPKNFRAVVMCLLCVCYVLDDTDWDALFTLPSLPLNRATSWFIPH